MRIPKKLDIFIKHIVYDLNDGYSIFFGRIIIGIFWMWLISPFIKAFFLFIFHETQITSSHQETIELIVFCMMILVVITRIPVTYKREELSHNSTKTRRNGGITYGRKQ